jgi:hypothetical protein
MAAQISRASGSCRPYSSPKSVDTVNVTNVDLTSLGHSYVSNAREVLNDMFQLIKFGRASKAF